MNLPEARTDGICCDCLGKEAVTRDGRWCKRCLRARVEHDIPIEPASVHEERGRSQLDLRALGGQAERVNMDT